MLSFIFSCLTPESNEVLFEDKKIKISTFPLSHGITCNGFLFEEIRSPRKIISSKVKEYNIPIENLKTSKMERILYRMMEELFQITS